MKIELVVSEQLCVRSADGMSRLYIMGEHVEQEAARQDLALIVGCARSGTTLLRLLLDAHPEIGCPAEAGVPALMTHMLRLWMTIDADVAERTANADPGAREVERRGEAGATTGPTAAAQERDPLAGVPSAARRWIRESVSVPMRRYGTRGGKRLYVDKSLDSVYHLPLVEGLFPATKAILLVRHVMDTVASGIEASPWGFNAFGYTPYVQNSPGNTVAALAQYWLSHVTAALAWREENPELCMLVRYEDLVLKPEATITEIQRFLGVVENLDVLDQAFERPPARGPGDYKIAHTGGVHASSIGHGKRVPVSMLPAQLITAINDTFAVLGYDELTRAWNAEERPVDAGGHGIWAERLRGLMQDASVVGSLSGDESFAVVAEDHHQLRWLVEPETGRISQGDGEVDSVLTGSAEDLVLMLTGEENLGVLIRSGRVRHLTSAADPDGLLAFDHVARLLGVLGSPGDPLIAGVD